MIRADGAVIHCGEACGQLGTTLWSLRVAGPGILETVVPQCNSVDGRGTVISLPTGRDGQLSTIHRPTTTTEDRNKKMLENEAREGQ